MCQRCARGAAGHDGHAALNEIFRSGIGPGRAPAHVLFECGECGCIWSRQLTDAGEYTWTLKVACTPGHPRAGPA